MKDVNVSATLDELVDESRTADSGGAADLDDPAVPGAHIVEHVEQRGELGLASQEGRLGLALPAAADERSDDGRTDGLRLPFGAERLDRRRRERGARPFQHDLRREDLARLCSAHHPRGGVDCITKHPIGAAIWRTKVSREDLAGIDADPHRDDARPVDHLAQGPQHLFFVVPGA